MSIICILMNAIVPKLEYIYICRRSMGSEREVRETVGNRSDDSIAAAKKNLRWLSMTSNTVPRVELRIYPRETNRNTRKLRSNSLKRGYQPQLMELYERRPQKGELE